MAGVGRGSDGKIERGAIFLPSRGYIFFVSCSFCFVPLFFVKIEFRDSSTPA